MSRSRYPALQIPTTADPDLRVFLEGVKERLEITTGDRGDPRDRLLTVRDVEDAGMASVTVRNRYASLSGGVTQASVASMLSDGGQSGTFDGLSAPALEQLDADQLETTHDFILFNNNVARVQRVGYDTLRQLFLTPTSDAELSGNWVFTNESVPLEVRAMVPRLRFNEQPDVGETLDADSTLWDWVLDSQDLSLMLVSDDEATTVEMLELARDGLNPLHLALLNDTQLRVQDGVLADPGIVFDDDDDTGLMRVSANRFALVAGAVLALDVSGTQLGIPNGSLALPAVAFQSDTNTGLYRISADRLGLSAGGVLALDLQGTQVGIPSGSAGTPALAPQADPDTGLFSAAANVLGVSAGGSERVRFTTSGVSVTGTVLVNASTGHIDLTPSAAADFAAFKFRNNAGTEIWRLNSETDGDLDFSRQSGTGVLRVNTVSVNDAALFTTGTLDDARLSSNVPFKNTANVFTAANTFNLTPTVPDTSWTYAKLQNVSATSRVLGRITAGAGVVEELTGANVATIVGYTAADVLAKLITVDGAGSLLDSDFLDGVDGSDYARISVANNFTSGALTISGGTPFFSLVETDQSSDEQIWAHFVSSKFYAFATYTAGFAASRRHLGFTRGTGAAVTNIAIGNTTDNATVDFLGTGAVSIGGALSVTGAVTVPNTSFTYAKLQNVSATSRVLGRITAGAGVIEELTGANVATIMGYTASDVLTKLLTVDGSGSTLDADLLDAQDGTYYLACANFTGTLADARLSSNVPLKNTAATITALYTFSGGGKVQMGTTAAQSTALFSARGASNGIEFGHPNSAGYLSTLGYGSGSGDPFLAFCAEHGTNTNTFMTRGNVGRIIKSDTTGVLTIGRAATANADNQTLTNDLTISASGVVNAVNSLTVGGTAVVLATTYTAADVLAKLLTVDGAGSTLDADLLDGLDSLVFAKRASSQTISGNWDFTTRQYFGVTAANAALVTALFDGGTSLLANQEVRVSRVAAEPFWVSVRTNGSYASPTAILSGHSLGEFLFGGYDGSTTQGQSGRFFYSATEDWSGTAQGGQFVFQTTTTGSTTRTSRMIMGGNSTGGYVQFPSGAAAQPGIGFASDTDNGFYLSSTNEVSLSTGGAQRLQVNSSGVQAVVPFLSSDGSVSAPGVTFANDTDCGLYRIGANNIAISVGNSKVFDIGTATGTSYVYAQGGLHVVQPAAASGASLYFDGRLGGTNRFRYTTDGGATSSAFAIRDETAGIDRFAINGSGGIGLGNFATIGTVGQAIISQAGLGAAVWGAPTFPDGTVGAPGVAFQSDLDCGLYRIGTNNIALATNGVLGFAVDSAQRVYGSALHNNASSPTGTTNQYIASGTYTPTLTNVTNVAASTAFQAQWMRVGNVVTVSGKVSVDPTTTGATVLGISLPIASNLGAVEDCSGTAFANAVAGQGAAIWGDATNDRASMEWVAVDVTNQGMSFIFLYEII